MDLKRSNSAGTLIELKNNGYIANISYKALEGGIESFGHNEVKKILQK